MICQSIIIYLFFCLFIFDRVSEGALIHSTQNSYNDNSIVIEVKRSEVKKRYFIGLCLKEIEIDYCEVKFDKHIGIVNFNISKNKVNLGGVFRVTLYTKDQIAVAERLIYVNPKHSIKVNIESDKDSYNPGETVELTIHTYNEENTPINSSISI